MAQEYVVMRISHLQLQVRHGVDGYRRELGQLQKQITEKKKAGEECGDLLKQKVVLEGVIKREEKVEQYANSCAESELTRPGRPAPCWTPSCSRLVILCTSRCP